MSQAVDFDTKIKEFLELSALTAKQVEANTKNLEALADALGIRRGYAGRSIRENQEA